MIVEVSKAKMNQTFIVPTYEAYVERDGQLIPLQRQRRYYNRATNTLIGSTEAVTYRDEYVLDGERVDPSEIKYFTTNPETGEREASTLFSASKMLKPMMEINQQVLSSYKIEEFYEVFINQRKYSKTEYERINMQLYSLAERWIAENKVGMGKWVHREGRTIWPVFIFPTIRQEENKFKYVWIMATSNTKMHYENMMDAPQVATITVVEEPKIAMDSFLK